VRSGRDIRRRPSANPINASYTPLLKLLNTRGKSMIFIAWCRRWK